MSSHLWIGPEPYDVACGTSSPARAFPISEFPGKISCPACLSLGEKPDPVKHPSHYNWHPSGVECMDIASEFNYFLGNAIKYIWRADHKGKPIEDLKKARNCIDLELQRRAKQ